MTVPSSDTDELATFGYKQELVVLNVGNQRAFFVLTSVAIIMFSIAYLAKLRGRPAAVLAEHRAEAVVAASEPA